MAKQKDKEYGDFREAGIRLTEPPARGLVHHSSELERPILYAIHAFDKAHLVMLAEQGLLSRPDAVAMLLALREMEKQGVEETRMRTGGGFHSAETYLIATLGEEIGGRIHLGRSSGDLGVVARRIHQRDQLLRVMDQINRLRGVLLDAALRYSDAVMPGYTFGQHAQPVTLGHSFAAWSTMLARDYQRIQQAYGRINTSAAGAVILTGTDFPISRQRTADLLGFDGIRVNTQDAILPHDDLFESLMTLTLLGDNLGRWASDLELWSTSEFGYVELPDRFCGTSSVMPQKKNPNVCQNIRGSAADCLGGLITALTGLKGPTGFPILERHYVEATLRRAFDNLVQDMEWLAELIPALHINRELMLERSGMYWAQATDVAGMLVREKDLPWRTAHQITGILVRLAVERGLKPLDITPALLDEAGREYFDREIGLSSEALLDALDPAKVVGRRTVLGGPAPSENKREVASLKAGLHIDSQQVAAMHRRLASAAAELELAIDRIVA